MLYFHLFLCSLNFVFPSVLFWMKMRQITTWEDVRGSERRDSKKMILMDFSYTLMIIGVEVERKKISLLNEGKQSLKEGHDFLIKTRSAKIQSKVQREVFYESKIMAL